MWKSRPGTSGRSSPSTASRPSSSTAASSPLRSTYSAVEAGQPPSLGQHDPRMKLHRHLVLLSSALVAAAAFAQTNGAPTGTSQPQNLPIVDSIPAPRDVPYP